MGDENRNLVDVPAPPPAFDTRHASQAAFAPVATEVEARILSYLRVKGGATCDEVEVDLELSHQTASGRIAALRDRNLIHDTGERRKARSGRPARIMAIGPSPAGLVPQRVDRRRLFEKVADEALEGFDVEDERHLPDDTMVYRPVSLGALRALARQKARENA